MENPETADNIELPRTIAIAIGLYGLDIAIGIVRDIFRFPEIPSNIRVFMLIMTVVLNVLFAYLVLQILNGKNWARVLSLILFLIGIPRSYTLIRREFPTLSLTTWLIIIEIVLEGLALILIFTSSGNEWFKSKK